MRRFLPSLGALQAFEAAARHLSFTRAAEELRVTQSAVSRQVMTLEDFLGQPLFRRVRRRLSLTEAGATYLPEIRACLDRVERATYALMASQGGGGVLNLAILPTFGTKWLIPRLPAFSRAHPDIVVNFTTRTVPFDFAGEELDAAIHFGDSQWPGAVCHRLMGEEVVCVCAPALLNGPAPLAEPADLAHHTLLQHTTRPRAWQDWLAAVGCDRLSGLGGPRFEHFSMVIQAAIAGLGVAVLPRFLVAEEIADGRLAMPFPETVRSAHAYYLVYPEANRTMPRLRTFRDWLLAEAAAG